MAEERYYIDVLLPGFIEASSGIQFGEPCLTGTRMPYSVGLGWLWEYLDRGYEYATREQIIALGAFHAGVEWQRSRKRRARMQEEVEKLWNRVGVERRAAERAKNLASAARSDRPGS